MAQPNYGPLAAFGAASQQLDRQQERLRRMGLTERQLELNHYYAYYCATQYEGRAVAWDGRKTMSYLERDQYSRQGVLPPGFVDPTGALDEIPLQLRAPLAPYHLVRVVVNRFTGLLFSEDKQPIVKVQDDPELQGWIENLINAARLWVRFDRARTLGGAIGSVAMTFRFRNGRPMIEVHDTRWCTPTFVDITTGEISALEIRYMYPLEVRRPDGILEVQLFWYRRIIDQDRDVIFEAAPVGDGDEPFWKPQTEVMHGCRECPGVWIRNSETTDMDGDPDCFGEFEAGDVMDQLLSQSTQGALENADPTLEIASDEFKLTEMRKGSRNALKLEKGASAQYIEMSGSGVDTALKVADVHRRNFLEVVQCVLEGEQDGNAPQTATEIRRRYSAMYQQGSRLREQYGEHGVKPLLAKIIRAVGRLRSAGAGFDPKTNLRLVPEVKLPAARSAPGGVQNNYTPELADFADDWLELSWPPWVENGAADAQAAAGAVATARSAQALDQESAVAYLAPYFKIDNPAEVVKRIKAEQSQGEDQMMGGISAAGQDQFGSGQPAAKPPNPAGTVQAQPEPSGGGDTPAAGDKAAPGAGAA